MSPKFGTFKGVFIPSTEAILGTVLFLLLPALTADAGLFIMLAIVVLAHTVSLSTAFSLADIATNLNKIGGGGMYALSKKSLGKALGGSIGIQLYLAQAASISFYCIGFAEPLQPLLQPLLEQFNLDAASPQAIAFQKQLIATSCFLFFLVIVLNGANFTLKIETAIFVILLTSIAVIFFSPLQKPHFQGEAVFTGSLNLEGSREITLPLFFLLFTQFFPAVTGIDAGVGMSGDLKEPGRSLVRGTFSSIAFTFTIYLIATFIFSGMDRNLLVNSYHEESPGGWLLTEILGLSQPFPANLAGLLVLLGILFATSSSALSLFMTAPRTLQSLAHDHLLPRRLYLLENDIRPHGKEPRLATLLTSVIALTLIWVGNINFAATVVGVCFLLVYGWVNIAAFLERISQNPTFRPTSKNHWSVSLYGFLACTGAIMLFSPLVGVITIAAQYIIFRLLLHYKTHGRLEGVWWGVIFTMVELGLSSIKKVVQGSKNFRPIVSAIAFLGEKSRSDRVAYLARALAEHRAPVHLNIFAKNDQEANLVDLRKFEIPTRVIITKNFTEAILAQIQSSHPTGIQPNTMLMEFNEEINSTDIVKLLLFEKMHILILKNGERFLHHDNIDIWWGSEKNGNLMLLLAYIMNSSYGARERERRVRILHIPSAEKSRTESQQEIERMLHQARLSGEVKIVEPQEGERPPMNELIEKYSYDKDLVLLGLPGTYIENGDPVFFSFKLDEFFFEQDLRKYDNLPPILFVRSAFKTNLIEE